LITEIIIEVRSTHVDELGHANNARFVEYLEWGRFDWFDRCEVDWQSLAGPGISAAVVNLEVDFLKEARRGDQLRVKTALVKIGNKSFVYHQLIERVEDQKPVCRAKVTGVTFDLTARKAAAMPDDLRAAFAALIAAEDTLAKEAG
jgi:thioesterase-3